MFFNVFHQSSNILIHSEWKYIKLFVIKLDSKNFGLPIIKDDNSYIVIAEDYLTKNDYKASSVYIRTAFEETLKKYCDKRRKKVTYQIQQSKVQSNDFWEAAKADVEDTLKTKIETYRSIVMNPFSHDDLTKPQYKIDLINTIEAVKELKTSFG